MPILTGEKVEAAPTVSCFISSLNKSNCLFCLVITRFISFIAFSISCSENTGYIELNLLLMFAGETACFLTQSKAVLRFGGEVSRPWF